LARILSDTKKDREADDEFAFAARLAPGNPDCYFYWSFAERAQGNFAKEAELLQKVVKLEPGNVKAHIMFANSLLDLVLCVSIGGSVNSLAAVRAKRSPCWRTHRLFSIFPQMILRIPLRPTGRGKKPEAALNL
jgi:tetratricopeptide (TPR) repeat protein